MLKIVASAVIAVGRRCVLFPEEAKQSTALEKKRLAEEKEQEKLNAMAEKARKIRRRKLIRLATTPRRRP